MKKLTKEELLKNPLVKEIAVQYRDFSLGSWDLFLNNVNKETKPEYTILSFKYIKPTHWLHTFKKGDIVPAKLEGGMYWFQKHDTFWDYYLENAPFSNTFTVFEIHSVRRESDGEVFTVGDHFEVEEGDDISNFRGKIAEFDLSNGKISVRTIKGADQSQPYLHALKKVKKAEWEINAFRQKRDKHPECIYPLMPDGNYGIPALYTTIQNCLEDPDLEIYSIKRLSDGVEFTVRDKVRDSLTDKLTNNKVQEINGFMHGHTPAGTEYLTVSFKSGTTAPSSTLTKVEKLFTTEDGVDVYDGDQYYFVPINTVSGHPVWKVKPDIAKKGRDFASPDWKDFSTKEKAEEFILYNKPIASMQDVLDLWVNFFQSIGFEMPCTKIDPFKEFVEKFFRNRLNLQK